MSSPLCVLIVEDDFLIRACLTEFLQDDGATVLEAESCAEAFSHLRSDAVIDVMITDISLPDGNGKSLSRAARTDRPDLPVIFTTGYSAGADGLAEELRSRDRVISKPYPLATVLRLLHEVTQTAA
ncbi:response regulator [Acidomonas methanolica]|uniref:response regulator n=1 Tax=Acidomonas methanolica TaxID=437 RepID=UPI00211A87E8|nr:response regulator [Acidomonas methanolica]MCQ9154881.1 response regulator [Acidomonas methanolica]